MTGQSFNSICKLNPSDFPAFTLLYPTDSETTHPLPSSLQIIHSVVWPQPDSQPIWPVTTANVYCCACTSFVDCTYRNCDFSRTPRLGVQALFLLLLLSLLCPCCFGTHLHIPQQSPLVEEEEGRRRQTRGHHLCKCYYSGGHIVNQSKEYSFDVSPLTRTWA